MTLTFDLDLIFKVKGRGWLFSCFGVSMSNGFKVINYLVKKPKISGAITVLRGHRILEHKGFLSFPNLAHKRSESSMPLPFMVFEEIC